MIVGRKYRAYPKWKDTANFYGVTPVYYMDDLFYLQQAQEHDGTISDWVIEYRFLGFWIKHKHSA